MSAAPIKVLLVEDSPSDADVLQETLHRTSAGRFEFTWVERLADALGCLSRESFDVMLLDLALPDSSGPDTFRRAHSAAPHLPIVVLTGVRDESLGLAAVHEGVQDYLVKGQADGWRIARVIRYAIERNQAEQALVEAKEEWERTFDSTPDLIAILDNDFRILRANRAMAQRLGATPDRCAGQKCFNCVHGADQPPDSCPHVRTLKDGKEHVAEVHEARLGGDFLVSTTPLRDAQGLVVGSVHVARDITEHKQIEEKIRQQNAVLEGINGVFREALTCDTEEQLGRACLAVAERLTGSRFGFLSETNAQGRLDVIAFSDPGWDACQMGSLAKPGTPPSKGFFTNDPQSHPDSAGIPEGHPPLKAFLGVPLKQDGKIIGMIGVGNREGGYRPEDLEALEALAPAVVHALMHQRAERAVRAGEERLRQAQRMESIGLLAGGIAHDFNNLLTGIMGNASLLRGEVPDQSRDKLDAVISASEKGADLTRQLLAYAGKGRVVVEPLNLSRIIRDMTDLLRASIPKKVDLKVALDADLPGVEADRYQLQQIVMNLVVNGAEAIVAGESGTVTVTTGQRQVSEADRITDEATGRSLAPGSYVCLEVADTGCGMDEETRKKVFDPFFTTKFMGRGLGLAAVAGIVQGHKGAIQLETAPERGAAFRVFLPASVLNSKSAG